MNVFLMIRLVSILSIFLAALLFAGCASEEPLNLEEHAPVAGETTTPAPVSSARTGWTW
jgi:PBP1b-binding outer membrane lipoprotein LpoB